MSVDDRLREAFREHRARVQVSPDLLDRIEERAHRRRMPAGLVPALAVAAVVAAIALGVGLARSDDSARDVATDVDTRATFVTAADDICTRTAATLRDAEVVFRNPQAVRAVAEQRVVIARGMLRQLRDLPTTPSIDETVIDVQRSLLFAIGTAETVGRTAGDGELNGAETELRHFDEQMSDAGAALAGLGADACSEL